MDAKVTIKTERKKVFGFLELCLNGIWELGPYYGLGVDNSD